MVVDAAARRFLETGLRDLYAENSAICGEKREEIGGCLRASLSGCAPVISAAEALLSGIRWVCLERLRHGVRDEAGEIVPIIESFDARPLQQLAGDCEAVRAFLDAHPNGRWEVVEVVTADVATRPRTIVDFRNRLYPATALNLMGIDHLHGKMDLFEWMHPKGSRVVRHLPLELLLWDEQRRSGGDFIGVEFTARSSSLDDVRELLSKRLRPVLLKVPAIVDERGHYGSATLHDGSYDELKAFVHDVYHLRRWNEIPGSLRWAIQANVLALDACFLRAVSTLPLEARDDPAIVEARDELLSGPHGWPAYPDPYGAIFGSMDVYLWRLRGEVRSELWAGFERQIRASRSDVSEASAIIGSMLTVAAVRPPETSSGRDRATSRA